MSIEEKRAVLAAWASDAHAVENAPALRQLDDGSVVPVDDILRALNSLERTVDFAECADPAPRRRGTLLSRIRNIRLHRDDDDDPPPCPAAAIPVQWRRTEALAAAA